MTDPSSSKQEIARQLREWYESGWIRGNTLKQKQAELLWAAIGSLTADEPSLSHFAVLRICDAYEGGVGMGLRDDSKAPNMANPYKQGTPEYEAYAIGEDKGRTMERPAVAQNS